jgi:hypothetical protein
MRMIDIPIGSLDVELLKNIVSKNETTEVIFVDSNQNDVCITFHKQEEYTQDFTDELNIFCSDHFEHFGCYPIEFEYKGVVYDWNDFVDLIKDRKEVV